MEVLRAGLSGKSEKRSKYDSVVQAIREKHGGLEAMRAKLGFTQKQMSELLLVDPSAWTRWVRDGETAPAHIYQALAWYFESRPAGLRQPASREVSWKMANASIIESPETVREDVVTVEAWQREKAALLEQWSDAQKKAVGISDGWKLFLLMNSVALIYLIFSQLL